MKSRALLLLFAIHTLTAQVPEPKYQRPAPDQPLPFSHRKHAGELKVACAECHPIPGNGDFATLPATTKCMTCHAAPSDSTALAKLRAYHADGKKIPWAPVYRIPEYVSFNHRKHVAVNGVTCATCHGPVAERDVLRREKDITMAACMECHRTKAASNDCTLCHDQR
jgi:hypothetical protein